MSNKEGPSSEWLRHQVEAYGKRFPRYQTYAAALERVLERACRTSIPEAIVQARPKSVASFAEKCIRKFETYRDPAEQFTDLCGARVIVQTLEQIRAVRSFIESNFEAFERDDKASLLGENKFGYRDMHYLVRLRPEQALALGFTDKECETIGDRIAEVQVRSLVQHAWADILHDRMYKAPLKLSTEAKRTGALLAAIMEDGDRNFDQLAGELDSMAANYSAYAGRSEVEKEIETQQLLLKNASDGERPKAALKLARLIASKGEWDKIIEVLTPHENVEGSLKAPLLLEIGHAFCRRHRSAPTSVDYQRGQKLLEQAIAACENPDPTAVLDLRRNRSIRARALARLGWSWEPLEAEAHQARRCYRQAAELEPANPYYLTDMLGFELKFAVGTDLVAGFRAAVKGALAVCQQHEVSGTELPAAFFTAGRLNMLLGEYHAALNDYACGVHHCLNAQACARCDFLEDEIAWLHRVHSGQPLPDPFRWAEDLLRLVQSAGKPGAPERAAAGEIKGPVLVVAGGASSLKSEQSSQVCAFLKEALADFHGTVISGGTTAGVPGCVGKAARELAQTTSRQFRLLGYMPKALPYDAEKDGSYELIVASGNTFSPAQVLFGWKDVIAAGVKPADVRLLGFGGGKIAAFEYRLALALGARVGVVSETGGAADDFLKDPLWARHPRSCPLLADAKTLRAFVLPDGFEFDEALLERMAQEFHARYRAGNRRKIKPDNLKEWADLPPTYKSANRQQAAYAVRILEAAGFRITRAEGSPKIFKEFTTEEIELMAELEHGRWNLERLQEGWRPGKTRDDDNRINPYIVPWVNEKILTNEIKDYDRQAVRFYPEILATAGLEICRK